LKIHRRCSVIKIRGHAVTNSFHVVDKTLPENINENIVPKVRRRALQVVIPDAPTGISYVAEVSLALGALDDGLNADLKITDNQNNDYTQK